MLYTMQVLFVGTIAVIEKHGIPHKVEFTGGSRRVIIDGNFSVTLAFGETGQVAIDMLSHTIRFGAPSRELYLGDYPICAIFGMPSFEHYFANVCSMCSRIQVALRLL